MGYFDTPIRGLLFASTAAVAMIAPASPAMAQVRNFNVPAQAASRGIPTFARQAGIQIIASGNVVGGRRTNAVRGSHSVEDGLRILLAGTGLAAGSTSGTGIITIRATPGSGEAEAGGAAADSESAEQQIVVTGTNIRSQGALASPIQVYTQSDIDRTGASTLEDFLAKVPQNFAGGAIPRDTAFITGGSAQNLGFGAGINLRGLGVGTTLTLVNGRRMAAIGNQPFVDISLIPTSAISRVEILSDGASAIYGSDAVGGVVNIILKSDFEGFETAGGVGTVTEGRREEYSASAIAGTNWAGGNAMLTYSYRFQDRLQASEKEFSRDVELQPLDLYPRSESHSVYGRLTQEILAGFEGNLSAMYARRDANGSITSDAGGGIFQNDQVDSKTDTLAIFAGVTADLPSRWRARLDGGYSRVSTTSRIETAFTNGDSETADIETSSDLLTGNVVVDGPLFTIRGGDVQVALGGEYQSLDYMSSSPSISDGRNVVSAFGEIAVPLFSSANAIAGFQELQLSAAVRYDHYSDFGDTTNPRFGAVWSPVRGLRLRGTYSESFRSPSLAQLNQLVAASAFRRTAATPVAPAPFVWIVALGGNSDLGPERARTRTLGVEYESDEGPVRFSGSVNYYKIDYRDRVERGSPGGNNAIFADPGPFAPILITNPTQAQIAFYRTLAQQGLGFRVTRTGSSGIPAGQSENDALLIIDNRLRNNAETSQQGLDLIGSVAIRSGAMSFGADFNAQYILDRTQRITPAAPELDAFNQPYLPVDFSFRAGLNASYQQWYGSFSWNHVDAYANPSSAVAPTISAWDTFDLYFSYSAAPDAPGFLDGFRVALSVTNLFDAAPPFVPDDSYGVNYDPANADPLGRFVRLTFSKRW